jgi:hypothetical protein
MKRRSTIAQLRNELAQTQSNVLTLLQEARAIAAHQLNTPIPMRLTCPACSTLHIDEGEFATKPHHTHSCQSCGACWRPAVVCTVGVRFLPGFKNTP